MQPLLPVLLELSKLNSSFFSCSVKLTPKHGILKPLLEKNTYVPYSISLNDSPVVLHVVSFSWS